MQQFQNNRKELSGTSTGIRESRNLKIIWKKDLVSKFQINSF